MNASRKEAACRPFVEVITELFKDATEGEKGARQPTARRSFLENPMQTSTDDPS